MEQSLSDWSPFFDTQKTERKIHSSLHHLACYVGDLARAYATIRVNGDGVFSLERLVVDPDVYGQGLGSCLLAFTEKFIRARKGIRIEVNIHQEARTFFEKMGYCSMLELRHNGNTLLTKKL